jgi:fermentation-respiration switch protein FrsA (DUF1100 family)
VTHPLAARRRRRAVAGVVTFALTVVALASTSLAAAAGERPKATAAEVVPIGTYAIGTFTETFVDDTRSTVPNGSFPGADSRTLVTAVYYPATGAPGGDPKADAAPNRKDGRYPLILFSHGATANAGVYTAEATRWASAGYVVALPNYPSSSSSAAGGVTLASAVADVKNQPADASFVIDEVLELNHTRSSPLDRMLDPKRIGAGGHSLGAITTYGLVYSDCCGDPRVKAAIPMSGLAGVVDDTYFEGKAVPLLALHGDVDPIVPYSAGSAAYADAKGPKFLLTFLGAGHVTPFIGGEDAQANALYAATTAFWDRYLKGDRGALDRLREAQVAGATSLEEEPAAAAGARAPG